MRSRFKSSNFTKFSLYIFRTSVPFKKIYHCLGIQCYFELPVGGPSTIQRCPDTSSGCTKAITCKLVMLSVLTIKIEYL